MQYRISEPKRQEYSRDNFNLPRSTAVLCVFTNRWIVCLKLLKISQWNLFYRALIFWQSCWSSQSSSTKKKVFHPRGWGGGGILPYKRLTGMCRWVLSPFHDWIDYNGVAFSIELLEWGRTFSDSWGKTFFTFTVRKGTRMFALSVKSKVFFIQCKVDT